MQVHRSSPFSSLFAVVFLLILCGVLSAPTPGGQKCFRGLIEEETSSLTRRSIHHPSARGHIKLFHGTTNPGDIATKGFDLAKTMSPGDFHIKSKNVKGGVYLTDSLVAAAQYPCYGLSGHVPTSVFVLEFNWNGAGALVYEFPSKSKEWKSFTEANLSGIPRGNDAALQQEVFRNEMITGPMAIPGDKDLTPNFQQYTIIQSSALKAPKLQYVQTHGPILCKEVPKGGKLKDDAYTVGQGGDVAKFAKLVKKLKGQDTCVIM